MFSFFENFVVYIFIISCTCVPLPNGDVVPHETISDSEQQLQEEIGPVLKAFEKVLNAVDNNTKLLIQKGEFLAELKSLGRKAMKVDALLKMTGALETKKNAVELELKRIKAPFAVRVRIEFWECMLSPAYEQTKQFTKTEDVVAFHEKRWLYILNEKQDDPMVRKLLAFIKSHEADGMSKEVFARRISRFFHFTSNQIHTPPLPLEAYSTEELKQELEVFLGEAYDNLTFDVVCAFRKESPPVTKTPQFSSITSLRK